MSLLTQKRLGDPGGSAAGFTDKSSSVPSGLVSEGAAPGVGDRHMSSGMLSFNSLGNRNNRAISFEIFQLF